MKITIDRFEGDFAVIEFENGETADMPCILIPGGAKEGDVIEIRIDAQETELRKQRISHKLNDLFDN